MLTAFIRRENCPCTLAIRQSPPPFTEWEPITDFGECVQGMAVGKCGDRLFMFGRRRESSPDIGTIYYDRAKISVALLFPRTRRWFEYLRSGAHDCSYPKSWNCRQPMLVSYYSQHEYFNPISIPPPISIWRYTRRRHPEMIRGPPPCSERKESYEQFSTPEHRSCSACGAIGRFM